MSVEPSWTSDGFEFPGGSAWHSDEIVIIEAGDGVIRLHRDDVPKFVKAVRAAHGLSLECKRWSA